MDDNPPFGGCCPDTGHALIWKKHGNGPWKPDCPTCGPVKYEPPPEPPPEPETFSIGKLLRDLGYQYDKATGQVEIVPTRSLVHTPPALGRPMEKRIGRTERDATLAQLRVHFEEDRINEEEFNERMSIALQAKFASQLATLTQDLPEIPEPKPQLAPLLSSYRPPARPTPPVDRALNRLTRTRIPWAVWIIWLSLIAIFISTFGHPSHR